MLRAHRFLPPCRSPLPLLAADPGLRDRGLLPVIRLVPRIRRSDAPYQVGYENGRAQGENDARRGRQLRLRRSPRVTGPPTSATSGYGNRNAYREEFRQGFVSGYNDGYPPVRPVRPVATRRRGRGPVYGDVRRGPSAVVASPAAQNRLPRRPGSRGSDDAHDRRPVRSDPARGGIATATTTTTVATDSRDEYKREYRSAFARGYEAGVPGLVRR